MDERLKSVLQELETLSATGTVKSLKDKLEEPHKIPNLCLIALMSLIDLDDDRKNIFFSRINPLEKQLFKAIEDDDVTKLKEIALPNELINMLLITSLMQSKWKVAKELLKNKDTSLTYQDATGNTALHALATSDDLKNIENVDEILELVKFKLSSSVKTVVNIMGETALHFAVRASNAVLIPILVASGIDINLNNKDYDNALDVAIQNGDHNTIVALVQAYETCGLLNAEATYKEQKVTSNDGVETRIIRNVPLIEWSIKSGCVEILKIFSSLFKADVKSYFFEDDGEKFTSLQLATIFNQTEVMKHLIELGADIKIIHYKNNKTLLHLAVESGSTKAVQFLLDMGLDIHSRISGSLMTPLHSAMVSNRTSAVDCLIRNNANVNAAARSNERPLHLAVALSCSDEIIELLISSGANVNNLDRFGESALDIAVNTKKTILVALLLKYNAKIKFNRSDDLEISELLEEAKNPQKFLANGIEQKNIDKIEIALGRGANIGFEILKYISTKSKTMQQNAKDIAENCLKNIEIEDDQKANLVLKLETSISKIIEESTKPVDQAKIDTVIITESKNFLDMLIKFDDRTYMQVVNKVAKQFLELKKQDLRVGNVDNPCYTSNFMQAVTIGIQDTERCSQLGF